MITDFEQAVIEKAIEDDEIFKLLTADIGKCFLLNSDIWDFISGSINNKNSWDVIIR